MHDPRATAPGVLRATQRFPVPRRRIPRDPLLGPSCRACAPRFPQGGSDSPDDRPSGGSQFEARRGKALDRPAQHRSREHGQPLARNRSPTCHRSLCGPRARMRQQARAYAIAAATAAAPDSLVAHCEIRRTICPKDLCGRFRPRQAGRISAHMRRKTPFFQSSISPFTADRVWRRGWDSNPRAGITRPSDFESAPL